jgi:hypothetical protein
MNFILVHIYQLFTYKFCWQFISNWNVLPTTLPSTFLACEDFYWWGFLGILKIILRDFSTEKNSGKRMSKGMCSERTGNSFRLNLILRCSSEVCSRHSSTLSSYTVICSRPALGAIQECPGSKPGNTRPSANNLERKLAWNVSAVRNTNRTAKLTNWELYNWVTYFTKKIFKLPKHKADKYDLEGWNPLPFRCFTTRSFETCAPICYRVFVMWCCVSPALARN